MSNACIHCQYFAFPSVAIKESCPRVNEPDDVLCGIDGKTYQSACDLVSNSVLLAYEGSCRRECSDGKYQVKKQNRMNPKNNIHCSLDLFVPSGVKSH